MYVASMKSPYRGILLGGFDLFLSWIVEVMVEYEAFFFLRLRQYSKDGGLWVLALWESLHEL